MFELKKSQKENVDEIASAPKKEVKIEEKKSIEEKLKELKLKVTKTKELKSDKRLLGFNDLGAMDEAYKHIRAYLLNNTKHEDCPVFAMVSSKNKDDNTLTASNIAISFAQLGKKTLFIEANMRTPKVNQLFGLVAERGLSDVLSLSGAGILDLSGAAIPSGMGCLDIIPSGPIPNNPSELLASRSFGEMLEKAKTVYEVVVLCLPPVCDYADASVISDSITGYIFAVRSEKTNGREAREAIDKLKANGGNIIGTVLTNVRKINNKV